MRYPLLIVTAMVFPFGAGCTYERVVSVRGGLYGLPGAQGGLQPEADPGAPSTRAESRWDNLLARFPGQEAPPPVDSAPTLRRTRDDGSVELISTSPNHVMYHLTQTLISKEYDLLLEQVISERTKQNYEDRGLDPTDAVKFLVKHEKDIARLFATMPMGEQTPGVFTEVIGPNMFRLRASSIVAPDLRFTAMDVIIERGRFRLLVIGNPRGKR